MRCEFVLFCWCLIRFWFVCVWFGFVLMFRVGVCIFVYLCCLVLRLFVLCFVLFCVSCSVGVI